MTEDRLFEILEEALASRVIEELPHSVGQYQFTHALIQETLAEELSLTRRVRLHARIAQALEQLYGDDADSHAAELAHHFSQAEATTGTEKLVRYSLLAGERALASHAHEDALAHYERGLVARDITLSGTETASDKQAADLLFGLARAQSATYETFQNIPFAILSRAFEYYAEAGNIALAVAAAEFPIAPPATPFPGVAEMLARALTLVPADSHEAGRLLSRYGGILGIAEADYEGAQLAFERAIAIARHERDAALEYRTLAYASRVSGHQLRWQESIDTGLRAIELAAGDEDAVGEMSSRWWTATSLLMIGDLDGARPHALALVDLAERRSTPRWEASTAISRIAFISCLEGDWKAGRESSDRGLELLPINPHQLMVRALLEHETGESAQGEVYLERFLGDTLHALVPIVITAIARITDVPDRLEMVGSAAEAVLSEQSVTPLYAALVRAGLALLAVQNGDQSAAKEHYDYLLGQRSTMTWAGISVDRLLGLLSQAMGNVDQAVEHFEDALDFCRRAGYRPELAWSLCDYADSLLQRASTSSEQTEPEEDRRKAMAMLDESLAISSELGMRPLMERVLSRREILGAWNMWSPGSDNSATSTIHIELTTGLVGRERSLKHTPHV